MTQLSPYFNETCHTYSSYEWALLKRFSRSDQGHVDGILQFGKVCVQLFGLKAHVLIYKKGVAFENTTPLMKIKRLKECRAG